MEHSVATIIDTTSSKMKDDEQTNDKKICDSEPVVYQLVRVIVSWQTFNQCLFWLLKALVYM